MLSTPVSAHGFKNEVYSCVQVMDLRTRYTRVFSALASVTTLLPCDQLLNLIMATSGPR